MLSGEILRPKPITTELYMPSFRAKKNKEWSIPLPFAKDRLKSTNSKFPDTYPPSSIKKDE